MALNVLTPEQYIGSAVIPMRYPVFKYEKDPKDEESLLKQFNGFHYQTVSLITNISDNPETYEPELAESVDEN
jgi:hypothetical protein